MMNFVFGTGTARGGTGILVQTLGAHPEIAYALDAYLAIYRSLRNDILSHYLKGDPLFSQFDPASPFGDYYYSDIQALLLETLLKADLSLPVAGMEIRALAESVKPRAQLDSGDLVPFFHELRGKTYEELFESAACVVAHARATGQTKIAGFHENWTVELLPAIARSFPAAKFLICLRDPRAVMASHAHAAADSQSSLLSYARGIRKLLNLSRLYLSEPLFHDRLMVVAYESIMREPSQTFERICEFLGVSYDREMINPERHFDRSTGGDWSGYSSFEKKVSGYNPERIERWRKHLPADTLDLIETVLDADMRFWGYMPTRDRMRVPVSGSVFQALLDDNKKKHKWRTDSAMADLEFGCELARHHIIQFSLDVEDPQIVKRCFLNEKLYRSALQVCSHEGDIGAKGGIWVAGEGCRAAE